MKGERNETGNDTCSTADTGWLVDVLLLHGVRLGKISGETDIADVRERLQCAVSRAVVEPGDRAGAPEVESSEGANRSGDNSREQLE